MTKQITQLVPIHLQSSIEIEYTDVILIQYNWFYAKKR